MKKLLEQVRGLQKSEIGRNVKERLQGFSSFKDKPGEEWFSELCFCLLTANSKGMTALNIQEQLGAKGFCGYCHKDLSQAIKKNKHRFHNTKASYIIGARCHVDIKHKIQEIVGKEGEQEAREWLVKNIKGFGYKEASHFLRNTGHFSLAVLDRHILKLMHEHGFINEQPKSLSRQKYLEIEGKFNQFAGKAGMSPAELDMYMWYMRTGVVLK